MIMNFINVMIARSTFIAEGEKRMTCCLCTNVLLQDRGKRKKLHEASCNSARHMLQNLCPDSFEVLGFGRIRMLLCGSLCENQLMKILKEEVGKENLKKKDERSKQESPKESSPK